MSESNEASPEGSAPVAEPIDLASSLHPFERSRLTIALVGGSVVLFGAVALMVTTVGPAPLLFLALTLAVFVGFIWVVLQVFRAQLLANAVKVDPESLPDVHAALSTVRKQLGYYRRVDVYVAVEVVGKATWLSFLGHRVILLEGDFVSGMVSANGQAGLRFVIGSFLGALKARHARLQPLLLLLQLFDAVKVAAPFMLPYHRATRYSGDQLGYRCSGDLRAAMGAVGSLLVGNLVAPELRVHGVINQIEMVQERVLPRLAQLFSPAPHLVNRYLNVLAFSARVAPREFRAFINELDENTRQRLELLLANTPHARNQPERLPQKKLLWPAYVGIGLAVAAVVAVGFVLAWQNSDDRSEPPIGPDGTPASTTVTAPVTPVSWYTAWELFGAAPGNGSCDPTSLETPITDYDLEEVFCHDAEYNRWFYKYSGIDPDGWVNALSNSGVYDTVTFHESASCYDVYTATYTSTGGALHNSVLYVFARAPFVAEVSQEAGLVDLGTILNADFYVTDTAVLC